MYQTTERHPDRQEETKQIDTAKNKLASTCVQYVPCSAYHRCFLENLN